MGRIAFQRARERYLNRLAVERLESCGLVSRKARKGKQVFRITPKGKRILHEVTGESKRLLLYPERWDGKWRIVAYDLPEDKRSLRNSLRYVLEKCGFLQAQKSVWVFPYDAPLLERLLSEQPDIASHTFFLRTERFSQDQAYRKHFKLK
jgi:phenylacetic acid degradation operon negative regulatory protein